MLIIFWAYAGKSSWPELVGVQGEVAAETIKRENPHITTVDILLEGTIVTQDFYCTRVRVWVDENGIVISVPTIG